MRGLGLRAGLTGQVPLALLLVGGGGAEPARAVPIPDRLFVGRTCHGIDEAHRLIVDGSNISRDHCQIHIDALTGRATLVDTSTNGTRLNGSLVERSVPVRLHDGDVVGVGDHRLLLRTSAVGDLATGDANSTMRLIAESRVCVVCGDLVDFTTLTQLNGGTAVFTAMHTLFDRLRILLQTHRGTLYDYVGDAFLAVWEEAVMPDAARRGVEFAIAATAEIGQVAPTLALRDPDGQPLRMGWAVTHGSVAMSSYAGSLAGLLGDVVNVGFRLASIAGRAGRSPVIVTGEAARAGGVVPGMCPAEDITVKGHTTPVTIREVALPVAG